MRRFLAQVCDVVPDGLLVVDPLGTILEANASAVGLFGRALVGSSVESLVPERLRGRHAALREAYEQRPRARRMGFGGRLTALRADGSEFPAEISLAPLDRADGRATLAIVRDQSLVRDVVQAGRRSEALLRAVVEHAAEGVWVLDAEGRTTLVNEALLRMLQLDEPALHGRRLHEFLARLDAGRSAGGKDAAAGREGAFTTSLRTGGGGWVRVRISSTPLADGEGEIVGQVLVVTDLTDGVLVEAERAQLQAAALRTEKLEAVARLAAGAAHDFNNALAVIAGFVEHLESEGSLPESAREDLAAIAAAVADARTMVRRLTAVGRRPSDVDVVDVDSSLREHRGQIEVALGPGIELQYDLGAEGAAVVAPAELGQVWLNLAFNARDAMPRGGTLLVTTRHLRLDGPLALRHGVVPAGEWARVSFRDTGHGMDELVLSRVFDPFFTTKETGTGLGLASVAGIVHACGGVVSAESVEGEFSESVAYLPIGERAEP